MIGVAKAYATRVGEGPFPTELNDPTGERLRQVGKEFGATTGRPRRCGWFDVPAARYAIQFCGVQSICITKLDVLSGLDEVRVCTSYAPEIDALKGAPGITPELLERVEASFRSRPNMFPAMLPAGAAFTPRYETLPGWKEPLDDVHDEAHLPPAARDYVAYLEKQLGVSIDWLSVGRRRDQLIARRGESPWPR